MSRFRQLTAMVVLIWSGSMLCGCSMVKDTEQMLSASGFQMKPANTPEKLAHLGTLTQHKLVSHERDGKVYYVFADAKECKCMYVGTEKQYQEYQKLAVQKEIANEQLMAADENEDADMDWGMWDGEYGYE